MLLSTVLLLLGGSAPPAVPPERPPAVIAQGETPAPTAEPSDERLRRAWSFLLPNEKKDVADWFRLEVAGLETFQLSLIRYILEESPIDAGFWPEREPLPYYDPKVHAPKPKVTRRRLAETSRRAKDLQREFLGEPDPHRLQTAWAYDWASGELRRTGPLDDPERIFANALLGYPPDIDLARELVLRALDDGAQRPALTAFGHAYADRKGTVFPGVTLYDAWNSGRQIEMPDVDALGIVHDVLDEWSKWTAPVPTAGHDSLYKRISELYLEARHHRSLREALADTFAMGEPPLLDYTPSTQRFHALWEKHVSTPPALAKELPPSAEWAKYMEALVTDLRADEALWSRGLLRQQTLTANSRLVRGTFARVMDEFGALGRTALPKPEPKKPPTKKDDKEPR